MDKNQLCEAGQGNVVQQVINSVAVQALDKRLMTAVIQSHMVERLRFPVSS